MRLEFQLAKGTRRPNARSMAPGVTCHWRTRRHRYVIEAVALVRAFLQCHIPDPMVAAVEVLHHVRGAQRGELQLVHEVARVAVADPYDTAAPGKGQGSAVTMRRGEQAPSSSAPHTILYHCVTF